MKTKSTKQPQQTRRTVQFKDLAAKKNPKAGLLSNTSFRVNTLTFSSNATGIG